MKKIFKKTLSLMLCVAFSGMQMSMATVLTNLNGVGNFAGADVLTGASIGGHTAGLKDVQTNAALNKATLKFNDNTRIDWTKFNVKSGEQLKFENGNFGVLNNVLSGMSTFAGNITSDSGKVIISNPNGMLFNGGTFNGGALILTTKDLTSLATYDDVTKTLNFDFSNAKSIIDGAANGSTFGAVAILGGSKITSPDFTIVANGVKMDGSTNNKITASASGNQAGVVMVTADGANFTANKTINFDGTSVKFYDEVLDVAKTAITAENGTITLVAGVKNADKTGYKDAYIMNTEFNGDVEVGARKIHFGNSKNGQLTTVSGDLDIDASHNVYLVGSNIDGNTTINTTGGMIDLYKVKLGADGANTVNNINSAYRYIRFEGEVDVNGDLNMTANALNMGYYVSSNGGVLDPSYVNVSGDLYADIDSTISFSDTITAKNITLISHESSILAAHVDDYHASLNTIDGNGNIILSAVKGEVTSLDGKVPEGGKSDYFDMASFQGHITVDKLAEYNNKKSEVRLNGGSADVTTKGVASVWTDLEGDLTVNAGGNALISGDVDGNMTVVTAAKADLDRTNVGGNLDIDAGHNVYLTRTTVGGNTDVDTTGGMIDLYKVKLGADGANTVNNLNSAYRYIRFEGEVNVNGDLNMTANALNMGYYVSSNGGVLDPSTVNVTGDLYADIDSTIGYSDTVTAKNITLISHESSILSANTGDYAATLKTIDDNGTITLSANKGEIVSLDGNVPAGGKSAYYEKMSYQGHLTADKLADVAGSKSNVKLEGGNASLSSKGVSLADANLKGNLNVTSSDANAAVTGKADGNVVVNTKTDIDAANLTAGDVQLTSSNGNIGLNNVTSTGNVKGTASNGTVSVTGDVTADSDVNGAGDVVLTAKQLSGSNFSSTNSAVAIKGANVRLEQTDAADDMKMSNITAVGLNDANGNVTIIIPGSKNVDVANVNATHNITLLNDADIANRYDVEFDTVKLNKVHADSESNGRGDINIRAKGDITANDISGANIYLASKDGNVSVTDATSARSAADTTAKAQVSKGLSTDTKSGNIVVTSDNGNIVLNNLTAASDIVGLAENGTVSVLGNLTADAEDLIGMAGVASNTYGDVILSGNQLLGDNFSSLDSAIAIQGASVKLTQSTVPANNTMTLSNITALAVGNDNAGDITIAIPAENVDLKNIHATHDINVLKNENDNPGAVAFTTVKLEDVVADSEKNGRGELNLKATGDIIAKNIGGANITLTSTNGDVDVDGAESHRGAADITGTAYGNVKLTAENGDVKLGKIDADSDIVGSAVNGNVNVAGYLTADAEGNTYGDVILTGKQLTGDNFTTPVSAIAIKGANVELTQSTPQDNLVLSNITAAAAGNDNAGDVTINVPVKSVDLNNINATKDIVVDNGTADGVLDSAKLTGVYADSEGNGIGDLKITTKDDITANGIGGANIELTSKNGNITVNDADSKRGTQPDANAGNITLKAENGDITVGDVNADTDIMVDASNGAIIQTGDLIADATDHNGVGTVTLLAKDGLDVGGDKGAIKGGDIVLEVTTGDIIASGLEADGQGDDNHGNISIYTPNGNVTIGTDTKPVKGTGDVTIVTDNGKATVKNTEADSEQNGIGTLTIKATDDVDASNVGGGNVGIESTNGNVTAEDVTAHAPNDNNNGDVKITANNGDVTVDGVNGDHDVIITAGGDANVTDAHADTDNNKAGDLIINAGGKADIDNGSGNNVGIVADGDITANDIKGNDDVVIISNNGSVTATDVVADAPNPNTVDSDGIGDLIIKGKGDVDVDGGSGANVTITSDKGDVDANDIHATGDDDHGNNDTGNIDITANNGNVTITNSDANGDIVINVTDGTVTAVIPDVFPDNNGDGHGDLIINRNPSPNPNPNTGMDSTISQEVLKNLNNLLQSGIDSELGQSFTPIGFAADDEEEGTLKRIVKTVFKTPETGIVTITDRFKSMK